MTPTSKPRFSISRPYRALAAGTGSVVFLSLPFRPDAYLGDAWLAIVFVLTGLGVAIQYFVLPNPRIGAGRRWLLYWGAPSLVAWLMCWLGHTLWVIDRCTSRLGTTVLWEKAVVFGKNWPVSSECERLCAELAKAGICAEATTSNCICIECSNFDRDIMETCGGKRILLAKIGLRSSYSLFLACMGGVIGLALLPLPPIRVFISYRRLDSEHLVCGRMAGALRSDPEWQVFIDDKIKGGARWRIDIRKNAETCDAFVIVIGPEWLEELKKRTAAGEKDWVRYEIETGIRRGVTLVPVVFGGAAMPSAADLGAGLDRLADIQAVDLNGAVTGEGGDTVVDEEAFEAAMEEVILAVRKARSAQLSQDWRGRGQDLTP